MNRGLPYAATSSVNKRYSFSFLDSYVLSIVVLILAYPALFLRKNLTQNFPAARSIPTRILWSVPVAGCNAHGHCALFE
jgi:hypothetical protein